MAERRTELEGDVATNTTTRTGLPPLYKVLLLNDDFTPMDFVVKVLIKFFKKPADEATEIMLKVHHEGVGLCGVYPRELAETKVVQVNQHARDNGHPLKCTMEAS